MAETSQSESQQSGTWSRFPNAPYLNAAGRPCSREEAFADMGQSGAAGGTYGGGATEG